MVFGGREVEIVVEIEPHAESLLVAYGVVSVTVLVVAFRGFRNHWGGEAGRCEEEVLTS